MNSSNPFDDDKEVAVSSGGGALETENSRAIAEVQAQVIMARRFPRSQRASMDRILQECERVTLAEKAIYSYPRGGTAVTGPSIRLAEAIARAWGNMSAGIVEVDRTKGESQMLAYCWDLETNTVFRKEFRVSHWRDTKKGGYAISDERDIYELTANQGARRLRACILAAIPGDVVDAAVSQCEKTMSASVGDIEQARSKMVERFQDMGIPRQMIEERLGHRIDSIQAGEIVGLRTIYNSIKEGYAVPADFFKAAPAAPEDLVGAKPEDPAAHTKPASEDPETLWAELSAFMALPTTPAAAKKEIQEANANDEKDPAVLNALLEKVRATKRSGK